VTGREDWQIARRKGIGGSDAAAILGISPWRTPIDVWLEKTGRIEIEREDSIDEDRRFLLDLGNVLERGIAELYTKRTGRELQQLVNDKGEQIILVHPQHPELLGNPDRLVLGESRGVEIKTENSFQHKFGEVGEYGAIPEQYEVQCRHYMAITNRDVWDLPVLRGAAKLDIHTIERDPELEEMLVEQLVCWWNQYVVTDTPPPIDGSETWTKYLSKQFRSNILPLKPADSEVSAWFYEREFCKNEIAELEKKKADAENHLRELIGEHEGIEGPFGRFTWKKTKDSKITDYEKAFARVRDAVIAELEDCAPAIAERVASYFESALNLNTTTKPGYRRFHHFQPKPTKQLAAASAGE
jgi:putative phage-type endonuclease